MLSTFRERYYVYLKQDCLLLAFFCVHLVMPRHFRSRDKDGGHRHTIRSTISKNPVYRKTSWRYVLQSRS